EVGCRGSKAAANLIMPDFGIACDVTPCNDTVGASFGNVKLGGGAAIKIKDSSVICSKLVTDKLTEIAEKNNIKYQYEVLTAGGTDTSSMQIAGSGCHAGCISIPSRYIHSPVEVVDIADVEACVALMTAFICE
ncbi:MAG: M42 family peptidase, partial [Clostridia bacterium]